MRKKAWLAYVLTGWISAGASVAAPSADLVLRHGAVYTLNDRQPWVQAVAVRGGEIVAVGRDADMAGLIGPATKVVDLQGRMLMPGVNDVHVHPINGAYEELFNCVLPPNGGLDDVLAAVKGCAQRAKPGDWIIGGPFSSVIGQQLEKLETLAKLDAAAGEHSVVLRDDSFHSRWVNSRVLTAAGITAGSTPPPGGIYVFEKGQPTGVLKELAAFDKVEKLVPPRSPERLLTAAQTAAKTLNAFGITAVQDAWVNRSQLSAWHDADRAPGGLSLRVVASLVGIKGSTDDQPGALALYDAAQAWRSDRLRPTFVKFFLDGVPPAYTAAMLEPYEPSPEHGRDFRGEPHYTLAQLTDEIAELDRRGIGVKLHSAGDGAVRLALDAIEAVRRRNGAGGPRHQVAHASFVGSADLPRFKRLNVVVDVSPMLWFPTPYTPLFEHALGHERTQHAYPIGSLVRAGALVAAGSDWPAGQSTASPWVGIEGFVTRRNPLGEAPGVLAPQQRLDLATALRLYTRNSAEAMGLGSITGSIEVGKSADFVELDQHLFKVPASRLHKTRALRTWLQGQVVYTAGTPPELDEKKPTRD